MKKIEEKLLLLWQDIIHQDKVDPENSFLDQGGNSLHFIKLASLASKLFKISLSPVDIFTANNISQLAQLIRERVDE